MLHIQSLQGTLGAPYHCQTCTTVSAAVYSHSCSAGWKDTACLMNKNTLFTALITTALNTFFSDGFPLSTPLTRGCLCCVVLLFRAGTEVDRVFFRVMITVYWETLLHCSTAAKEHFRNYQLTYKHTKIHKSKHSFRDKMIKHIIILINISWFPQKYLGAQPFSTLIKVRNVSWASNQHIKRIMWYWRLE